MPNIFDYLDPRLYLMDWSQEAKTQDKKHHKKWMAAQLDSDAGFLGKILDGKKKIPTSFIFKFIEFLKLKKIESEYFEWLVKFSRAKNHTEKKECLDKLTYMRQNRIQQVNPDHYELYENWYYSVVLQLLEYFPFRGNYKHLSGALDPPIGVVEAKNAIRVLEKLKLIEKNGEGYYKKTKLLMSTGEGWQSVAIAHYQMENIKLAQRAFEKYSQEARRFSTLTLTVSDTTIEKLLKRLKEFELECLEESGKQPGDRVYQFNFQAFPVSKIDEKEEKGEDVSGEGEET